MLLLVDLLCIWFTVYVGHLSFGASIWIVTWVVLWGDNLYHDNLLGV